MFSLPVGHLLDDPVKRRARLADNTKPVHTIGKVSEVRDDEGLVVHSVSRTRNVQSSQCHIRRHEKSVHSQYIGQLNRGIGQWQGAWLLRRIGIRSILELRHMLAGGIAARLLCLGLAIDLMDAFGKLIRMGVWIVWWAMTEDISLSLSILLLSLRGAI